jgi:DNA gyrase subunit A
MTTSPNRCSSPPPTTTCCASPTRGGCSRSRCIEIPEAARTSRGRSIVNLIELRSGESVCAFLPIQDFEKYGDFLVFGTEQGLVKRTSLKLYRNVNRGGLIAVSLKDGDRLIGVTLTSGADQLMLCTRNGMAIRFDENDARAMGRSAAGVKGINLAGDDRVVALVKADDERQLLTMCEKGYGKRTDMSEYLVRSEDGSTRCQSRGGKGRIDINTTSRNGKVAGALSVSPGDQVMLITEQGMIVRSRVEEIRQTGRATQGVRVINLKEGDRLISAGLIAEEDEPPVEEPAESADA